LRALEDHTNGQPTPTARGAILLSNVNTADPSVEAEVTADGYGRMLRELRLC